MVCRTKFVLIFVAWMMIGHSTSFEMLCHHRNLTMGPIDHAIKFPVLESKVVKVVTEYVVVRKNKGERKLSQCIELGTPSSMQCT